MYRDKERLKTIKYDKQTIKIKLWDNINISI